MAFIKDKQRIMNKENEIVLFETKDRSVKLPVALENEMIWLTANQMAQLFDRDEKTIRKHINNVFSEGEIDKDNNTQKMRVDGVKQRVPFYTLDVIISVGYRVKSQRGVEFRQWANSVLKQYIVKGYAINEKRLKALEKTVSIQTRMLADALDVEEKDVLKAVNMYTEALSLLDDYDHQSLKRPKGSKPIYVISYKRCCEIVDAMKTQFQTDVFGVEKEHGKVEGILASIYQSAFGEDAYPSLEEKAANLLYFLVKDHPYNDGCKRIAASLFLDFLSGNDILLKDGTKRISDGELVAITLMIAESKPEEKEIMISLVMNFLTL